MTKYKKVHVILDGGRAFTIERMPDNHFVVTGNLPHEPMIEAAKAIDDALVDLEAAINI